MLTIKCPCQGCTERSGPCHDTCDRYAAWKRKFEAQRASQTGCSINDTYAAERVTRYKSDAAKSYQKYRRYKSRRGG